MKLLLIGDVHGLVDKYNTLLKRHKPERSIQLGDFGFRKHHEWHRANISGGQHRVLFGNHDDPGCLPMLHSLGDFGVRPGGIFYVRGADSIDRQFRIEGKSWWPEEELSYGRFQQAVEQYEKLRPSIVLSHDCPQSMREMRFGIPERSRTSQALQAMFDIHQPALWVFGHHHLSVDHSLDGTRFVCLDELEAVWLDTDTLELTKP